MTSYHKNDCVHYHACRRCQSQAESQRQSYLILECWECPLYVSRYDLLNWWHEGLEMGYLIWNAKKSEEAAHDDDIPSCAEITF